VIWRKTGGNPFFINQFMNRLYETGLIHLDLEFGWKWDIEKINAIPATENVLALLKGKIDALTASEKMTLKLCACLGGSFEFDLLSRVGGSPIETVVSHLDSASQAGLVAVERDRGWFLHDKIMESIYSTIPLSERQAIHYRIGTTLLKITPPSEKTEKVFPITDHFNHGAVLITDRYETLSLVGLNLDCARKAKGSSAYIPAYDYLEKAIDLLPRNSWETDYDLTLATYTECVEVAYLKGDYARMHHLGEIALIHARTFIDKMDIYKAEINACVARQDFDAALSIGLFFQDLVLHYPATATRWDVLREYIGLKIRLFGKNKIGRAHV
jgi:predicted ATPase